MKTFRKIHLLFALAVLVGLSSCKKDDDDVPAANNPTPSQVDGFGLGWFGEDNLDSIPAAVNFSFGDANFPSSVDLVPLFPPIGDQGQYGTCVSWAVGYNIKTALSGQAQNWGSSDLTNPANQASPKDLFTAIPDFLKGPNCNGTNFESALDVMQNRGVASMQTVPYTNLGDCSESGVQGSWTSEASGNKIGYWRKIDASVNTIKDNLVKNIPVILGAKLADNFMTWNTDDVLTSSSSFDNVGIHAYHAMVIAGYDDSKGPSGAFKVINSWGDAWGDVGYIWVDYNYLINEFCTGGDGSKPLFVATDGSGDDTSPPDNVEPGTSGADLASWVFYDVNTFNPEFSNEREIGFNIYNIGSQAASPSSDWNVYYVYFNAYDANDYGVIYYDEFNTSVAQNTFECPTADHCIFNLNIPSGSDFAYEAFGTESLFRTYYMPSITGEYYLALVVDADNVFQEDDEFNNVFYTTLYPKYFDQGWSKSKSGGKSEFTFKNSEDPTSRNLQSSEFNTAVNVKYPNAYTTREITEFLKQEKRSGRLDQKAQNVQLPSDQKMYKGQN